MPVQLITAPTAEPVTLQEAKDQIRLQDTALDDAYLNGLITTARTLVEQITWRGLVTQVWELILESFQGTDTLELGRRGMRYGGGQSAFTDFPRGNFASCGYLPYIELPKGNVTDPLSSVKYTDNDGSIQTLSPSVYSLDVASTPARLWLGYGQSWPITRAPQWDAVRIRYTVGWAVTLGVWAGPAPLKHAMLLILSQLYEGRSPEEVKADSTVDALLAPYRLIGL